MTTTKPGLNLIGLAEQILSGVIPVPGGKGARAAAVVARQALEEAVASRAGALVTFTRRPTMKSQLILLRELGDPDIGRTAQIAWDGLSSACHHHAFELQPTARDVRALLRLVTEVAES